ncbi:MAG: endonuclease III domain-containing protein [Candidatus Helarchaeota archaeon]
MINRKILLEILSILREKYGEKKWKSEISPLDILIKTILSQNTSDINSFRAFDSLKVKFPDWEKCYNAPVEEIEDTIKIGGLANVKSKNIKNVLEIINSKSNGEFNLDFLKEMDVDSANKWLKSLKGVGEKTAACTLIFGFNMPIFPVDTHILRVSKRLGLIADISLKKAHEIMKKIIPEDQYYESHLNLIAHGRKVCHSRNPKCNLCGLIDYCEYYNRRLVLKILMDNKNGIELNSIRENISNKLSFEHLINSLIKDNLIIRKNNELLTITELGIAYIKINNKNRNDILKNLIKDGYDKDLVIKLFKISKKESNRIL